MKKTGYLFATKQLAEEAIKDLNNYWHLPKENGLSEFNVNLFNEFKEGFFCYSSNDWFEPVFGETKEYDLTIL